MYAIVVDTFFGLHYHNIKLCLLFTRCFAVFFSFFKDSFLSMADIFANKEIT